MKTNVLALVESLEDAHWTSTVFNLVAVSRQSLDQLCDTLHLDPSAAFPLQCKASPLFMAVSKLWTTNHCKAIVTVSKNHRSWDDVVQQLPINVVRTRRHFENLADLKDFSLVEQIHSSNEISDWWARYASMSSCNNSSSADATTFDALSESSSIPTKKPSSPTLTSISPPKMRMLSIFTTTFRTSKQKLSRVVLSLNEQACRDWEWVIVDDSDTNEVLPLLESLAIYDLRIKIFSMKHSGYIGEVKSHAVSLCSYDWCLEVDHDDYFHPTLVEEILKVVECDPEVGFIFTDYRVCRADEKGGAPVPLDSLQRLLGGGLGGFAEHFDAHDDSWVATYSVPPLGPSTWMDSSVCPLHARIFNKRVLVSIGGFNKSLKVQDDVELFYRIALSGVKIARICGVARYNFIINPSRDNFTSIFDEHVRVLRPFIARISFHAFRGFFERLVPNKILYPTTLKRITRSTYCWHLPDAPVSRMEFSWHNGKMHKPHRDYETCSSLVSLINCSPSYQNTSPPLALHSVQDILRSGDMTVVLLVSHCCSVESLTSYLQVLEPIADNVLVMGHPDSVVVPLRMDNKRQDPAAILLRKFTTYSFGLDGKEFSATTNVWKVLKTRHEHFPFIINYAAKIIIKTSHVMYLDATLSVPSFMSQLVENCAGLRRSVAGVAEQSMSLLQKRGDENGSSSEKKNCGGHQTDVALSRVWGWLDRQLREESDVVPSIHTFYHNMSLYDVLGYWNLDQDCNPATQIEKWKEAIKTLPAL